MQQAVLELFEAGLPGISVRVPYSLERFPCTNRGQAKDHSLVVQGGSAVLGRRSGHGRSCAP